ncbi:MAG: small multi-drug export protein [Spirochaetales bacterium]|nr:small multi-drug export protein [Spirochaetales bacterium]
MKYAMPVFFCLLPIAELRGGIPYAYFQSQIPIIPAFIMCVVANAFVGPLVYFFLSTIHKLLIKWTAYQNFFEKIVERTRKKIHDKVEKYGWLGITLFVAIPLPITGAYTGALGAWILGVSKLKTILAVTLGVFIAGVIVTTVILGGEQVFGFLYKLFIKQIH